MKMRKIQGAKNERGIDLPLQIRTNEWEIPTNEDVILIIKAIFENEDRIYPRPKYKGSGMFMDEIIKQYSKHIEEKTENLADWCGGK